MRKQLKRLEGREFVDDVKKFIKSNHDFYREKKPEIKTLAKRLKEEYTLEEFYRVFNKFWKSGYHNERVLAVYTLKLYEDEFDKETWNFLIPRLKEIRDFDEAEKIGQIIGEIAIKYPLLKREIYKLSNKINLYDRIIAISTCFPLIKSKDWNFIFSIIKRHLHDNKNNILELNGRLLKEISISNKTIMKRFVLKNLDMPRLTFETACVDLNDLQKVRNIKKLENNKGIGLGWLKII